MASEIRTFTATIPAATPVAAPVTVPLTMPDRVVVGVEMIVPPGPQGQMGFALACSGQQMIPFNAGQWIVTDDEKLSWDLHNQITTGAWSLLGYNLGQYPHSVYVRFLLDYLGSGVPVVPTAIPAAALVSPPIIVPATDSSTPAVAL